MKEVELTCIVCNKEFYGPEPEMCCSGRDCGCNGQPIEPVVCSAECYDHLVGNKKNPEIIEPMTIQEKDREWAENEVSGFGNFTKNMLAPIFERAYVSGAAGAMEWVPVSERLPEEGQFLVIGENANGKQIVISEYSNKYGFTSIANVTHWMPLPPHPEKESV